MLLTCLLVMLAASPREAPGPLDEMRPYLVALNVADVERSAKWYEEMSKGSFHLEIVEKKDAASLQHYAPALKDDLLVHGMKKFAFVVRNVDLAAELLKNRGARVDVPTFEDREMKLRSFIVADPDGNLVQFVQELD